MLSSIKRFFERTLTTSPIIRAPTLHPSGTGIANPTTPTPPPTGVTVGPITVPAAPIPTITSVPTTPVSSPPVSAPSVPETVARLKQVGPTIAFINLSTVITDQQLSAAVAAMQIQLDRDFAPAWKTTANLMTIPNGSQPPSDSWIIYIMDTTDQAGALGYHDLTKEGNPLGKVFAKDDQKYGLSWTVTASHEVMEMLIDPYIQNTVFSQTSNTTGTLYALEVADACEDDSFGYMINNVLVSDFVYPTWFEDFRPPNSTRFDHMHVINAPLKLAKGGYIGIFPVPNTTGWTQRLADKLPARLKIRDGAARTMRRGPVPLAKS